MDIKQILQDLKEDVNDLWLSRYCKFISTRKQIIQEESHHIIPVALLKIEEFKYLKTFKENLINLSFREHFIAHMLLSKALPHNITMAYA